MALVERTDRGYRLANAHLARELAIDGGVLRTTAIETGGDRLPVGGDELAVHLEQATLTSRDLRIAALDARERSLHVRLTARELEVEITYELGSEPWIKKRVRVRGAQTRAVDLERLRVAAGVDLGGLGQPLFIDGSLFLGLEHPAGRQLYEDGEIILRHASAERERTAVLGLGFDEYVRAIRVQPPRSFVVFNTFYDVQGAEVNEANVLDAIDVLGEQLVRRRDTKLDAFCIDRGWEDLRAIWRPHRERFPRGLAPIRDRLQTFGIELGLWLPLTANGSSNADFAALDTTWGKEAGYELSHDNAFFCAAAPKYRAELEAAIHTLIREHGVAYFKHDYNLYNCRAPDHGHAISEDGAREAIVDAELDIFSSMRALAPDILINPSGGMWLSPWWLMHADAVWMQHCEDFGFEPGVELGGPRDRAMTYRDARIHRNLIVDRAQFPLSAIMTLGLIDGRLNRLGGEGEPLEKWKDDLLLGLGRGTMLKELYLSPNTLTDQHWDTLADAIRWSREHATTLSEGRPILGDPVKGEVYGYAHVHQGRAIVCLRNPRSIPQRATVTLPGSSFDVELPGLAVRIIA